MRIVRPLVAAAAASALVLATATGVSAQEESDSGSLDFGSLDVFGSLGSSDGEGEGEGSGSSFGSDDAETGGGGSAGSLDAGSLGSSGDEAPTDGELVVANDGEAVTITFSNDDEEATVTCSGFAGSDLNAVELAEALAEVDLTDAEAVNTAIDEYLADNEGLEVESLDAEEIAPGESATWNTELDPEATNGALLICSEVVDPEDDDAPAPVPVIYTGSAEAPADEDEDDATTGSLGSSDEGIWLDLGSMITNANAGS